MTALKYGETRTVDRMRGWLARGIVFCVWAYVGAIVAVWFVMRLAGDRWWPATLLLFWPRWLIGVPIVFLLPFMALVRARYLWVLVAAFLFVLFAIMGFELPRPGFRTPSGERVRVLTYNVAVGRVSPNSLAALIQHVQPDIVALQESPAGVYADVFRDWHVCQEGDLLLAARWPLSSRRTLMTRHPPHTWPRSSMLHCTIADPAGPFPIATVHLPSPRYGLTAVVDRRTGINRAGISVMQHETANRNVVSEQAAIQLEPADEGPIVLGDFNMPIESRIYRRDWSRFRNAFSEKGFGFGWTVRGTRRGWTVAVRIDHVLTGGKWKIVRCWLGPDLESDHLPVIADLVRGTK